MVPPEDPPEIAAAIMRAVTDDELVDSAVAANDRVAETRLSDSVVRPNVIAMYHWVAENIDQRRKNREKI
jgi:hypothetical protein